ncbi:MAG TPA: universal stress protein [Chroococcidiopsis sp.]
MLRKLLVALDSSNLSQHVFDEALFLAKSVGAELGILHVTDPDETGDRSLPLYLTDLDPYFSSDEPEFSCYVGHFETDDEQLFGAYVAAAKAAGIDTDCLHCLGDPEMLICEAASAWGADLVVIGRRGRSGLSEMLLGSASNYAVHNAPCSVYVVHRPATAALTPSPTPNAITH